MRSWRAGRAYALLMPSPELVNAVADLASFLDRPLTQTIAKLEHDLDGCPDANVASVIAESGIDGRLLAAAMFVRARLGRVSDIIHAAAIALILPKILEAGETLRRPSLAAGNDPQHQFDLETDKRVAEFKLARWSGADAMRKRQLFKDLAHLAAVSGGRRRQLFVLGSEPAEFLRASHSSVAWALNRFPAAQSEFMQHFGSTEVEVCAFTSSFGRDVEIVDLAQRWPAIFDAG